MGKIFFIGDTHLFHKNVLTFKKGDGSPLRDFKDIHHMHAVIIENWLRVVKDNDKVYHLGDVMFHQDGLKLLSTLPGHKRLIRGNHDLLKTRQYLTVFQEIYGVRQLNGFWLTHVPMHLQCVDQPKVKANIHGHLHANSIDHPKYFNVSVEQINYTPISLDEIKERISDTEKI